MKTRTLFLAAALVWIGWCARANAGDAERWLYDPDPTVDATWKEAYAVQAQAERADLEIKLAVRPIENRQQEADFALMGARALLSSRQSTLQMLRSAR